MCSHSPSCPVPSCCFPSPVPVAEQVADGLSKRHLQPHNPTCLSHHHEGLVAEDSIPIYFFAWEISVDIKSFSEVPLTMELFLKDRPELEQAIEAALPFKPCFSALGHLIFRLCFWFCDSEQS